MPFILGMSAELYPLDGYKFDKLNVDKSIVANIICFSRKSLNLIIESKFINSIYIKSQNFLFYPLTIVPSDLAPTYPTRKDQTSIPSF